MKDCKALIAAGKIHSYLTRFTAALKQKATQKWLLYVGQ